MTICRRRSLRAALVLALCATAGAVAADRLGLIERAQAQSEEEKKKKEREKHKPPEKQPPPPKTPPPPPKAPPPPPPPRAAPPPPPVQKHLPPPERKGPGPQFQGQPQHEKKPLPPATKPGEPQPDLKKDGLHRRPPGPPPRDPGLPPPQGRPGGQPGPGQHGVAPPQGPAAPGPQGVIPPHGKPSQGPDHQGVVPPRGRPGSQPGPGQHGVAPPQAPAGPHGVTPPPGAPRGPLPPAAKSPTGGPGIGLHGPKRFEDVRRDRHEQIQDGGRVKVIREPGNRVIVKESNRAVIRHDEAERFARHPGARTERRADGHVETYHVRPDGTRVVTVVDEHGRLLRRYRRDHHGREHNIIDNRRFYRNVGIAVGLGVIGGIIALNLPPPRVTIPHDRYIVDYDHASDDDLYDALDAPPIEALERSYSLAEIRDTYELRARVRRIDLDTINFEFGAWEVGPDQYFKLERIARAILRLLDRNPEAVVMIEGHTDAVGSQEDNLSLSDRRASAVADILTDQFGVPAENLVTQGYGEQHLKINTLEPERRNRRVTILNITGLMAER
ncbi:MAG: OmpA family protein [Hyphomonadaceae bacterium]|nr:OmpA family protein [Hyphomonadaceae bacterium]